MGISLAYLSTQAANLLFMDDCDHALLILPKMQTKNLGPSVDTQFQDGGREHVIFTLSN